MKFEVGEFAIVVSSIYADLIGKLVLILEIQPAYKSPYLTDARVGGFNLWAADHNLRKLPPREEPESITRREECEA